MSDPNRLKVRVSRIYQFLRGSMESVLEIYLRTQYRRFSRYLYVVKKPRMGHAPNPALFVNI